MVFGLVAFASVAGLTAGRITAAPQSGDRTIAFLHIHTKETISVTYKKNGQYVPEAMKQIDWIMRDWRKNQSTRMDPETIDLIWEMHNELGSREPVNIICGYRSRDTNEFLRRTVGGQASQSQHITGKAVDLSFPDVPLKRMRYSALIRERGGVGYYPTSGIPFVHVDSARVRSWPRLPRFELALLFPDGRSKHLPADGGPISRDDVRVAQSKYKELAVQIAEFRDVRNAPKPVAVADAGPAAPAAAAARQPRFAIASLDGPVAAPAKPRPVTWEKIPEAELPKPPAAGAKVAALVPETSAPKPKLVTEPKLIERTSRFTPTPSAKDRSKLNDLVTVAANTPMPQLVTGPAPAQRPAKALAAAASATDEPAAAAKGIEVAALMPDKPASSVTDMSPGTLGNGWVQAPEFDEDHPEELAYRPFPLAPLLTETASAREAQFGGLQHPDVARTLDVLDDVGAIQPMKFRPGQQVAEVLWAQQFQGKAVHLDALQELDQSRLATGIESRAVKTSRR
jgi:uncharacterized protein YcbK (DUF882 family)